MADFKIGDNVRALSSDVEDRTGVIVAKGNTGAIGTKERPIYAEGKPKGRQLLTWWQVKMDDTNEIEEFPSDELEKVQ